MLNWFDVMRQAQNGAGLDNMARHFGLTPEQTRAAVGALIPAYAMGLQYLAANPNAMAQFFRMMGNGPYPNFWESASQAFTPRARQEGDRLLDQLFGSDEVSRRVAHQAAAFSGIGVDIMQQMLPLLAGIMAGGFARIARGQGAMFGLFTNPPGGATPNSTPPNPVGAWFDLWGRIIGLPPERQAPTPATAPTLAYENMMADFLNAAIAQERSAPPESPAKAQTAPQEPQAASTLTAWEQMMDASREMQRQHLASLQDIFEAAWGGGSRKR